MSLPLLASIFVLSGCGTVTAPSVLDTGLVAFGDSNTYGTGYQPSYPAQMHSIYWPPDSPFHNYGNPGDACWNQDVAIFNALRPQPLGNPTMILMVGSNDRFYFDGTAAAKADYSECQMAAGAYAALPSTSVVAGSSSQVQLTGTWSPDTTYPGLNGLVSTTSSSCATTTQTLPSGLAYLWFIKEQSSGGTFSVAIDGTLATDSITGASTLSSQTHSAQGQHYPALARFVASAGTHKLAVCTASATGASNDVHLLGFGFPPAAKAAAPTAPHVYLAGVLHYFNDPTDQQYPGLAIANSLNQQAAATLAADNLNVVFVDVRAYVDPYFGMLAVAQGNCNASLQPGFHLNNCGTYSMVQAYWQAIYGQLGSIL